MPLLAFFLLLSRVVPTQFCSLAIQVLFQLPPPPKALTSLASLIKKATAAPNSDIVQTEEEKEEESQNERQTVERESCLSWLFILIQGKWKEQKEKWILV